MFKMDQNDLTGYCILFGIFVSGLVTNVIVASKIIAFGPFVLPASVFIWAMTYPCSDIVAEVYGRKYANRMVLGGFVAFALAIAVIQVSVILPPASFWSNQPEYEQILGTSLRIAFAALMSYLITQFCDVYIFTLIREYLGGRHLWLRNNLSTMISQTLANIIFLSIAFLGTIPFENWIQLFTANLLVRYMLAVSDTALVYLGVFCLYKAFPGLRRG